MVPAIYRLGDQRLSLFSTLTQFGTPEDLMLDELKIEMFFPADQASAELLEEWALSEGIDAAIRDRDTPNQGV